MVQNIVLTSDGLIVLVANGWTLPEGEILEKDIMMSIKDFGIELEIAGLSLILLDLVLEHLENADATWLYFYGTQTNTQVAEYQGRISLNRDILLKAKGAWEYTRANRLNHLSAA